MALSANAPREYKWKGPHGPHEVAASANIFQGAALTTSVLGRVAPLTAGAVFVGFADERVNNVGGADAAHVCDVTQEAVIPLVVAGSGSSAVGTLAYASDDGTFTVTVGSNTQIGRLVRQLTSGGTTWEVFIQATALRS